ncbi:DUF1653 domain-containing protein [Candidatus Uhrbacteria bacterium]|nr:DUF1653 domain-containing protein [Candidatus Uhrbacteria bacterium]
MLQPGIYEHYKGNQYEVIGVAQHEETLEEFVVYRALYGGHQLWIRPRKVFEEMVDVDGKMVPRFKFVHQG